MTIFVYNLCLFVCPSALRAPEILLGEMYNCKADVWCVGVVFFEMLTGQLPHTGNSERELLANIKSCPVVCFPIDNKVSPTLVSLTEGLLTPDPNTRLQLADISILTARWMSELLQQARAQAALHGANREAEAVKLLPPVTATGHQAVTFMTRDYLLQHILGLPLPPSPASSQSSIRVGPQHHHHSSIIGSSVVHGGGSGGDEDDDYDMCLPLTVGTGAGAGTGTGN